MSGYGYVTTWGDRDKEPIILTMFHRLMGVVIARKLIKLAQVAPPAPRRRRRAIGASLMDVGLGTGVLAGAAFPEIAHEFKMSTRGISPKSTEYANAMARKMFRNRWARNVLLGSLAALAAGAWLNDQFSKD